MKISTGELSSALSHIGRDEHARKILIEALRQIDAVLKIPGTEIREEVVGPILDALFFHGEEVAKTLNDGTVINAKYTSKIIRDFVLAEEHPSHVWEPQTTRTALHFSKDATAVVIGGAYIGDHAVLMGKVMAASGTIHCFEPSSNADMLERNAAANDLTNICVNRVGLWSGDNTSLVLVGDDSHAFPQIADESAEGAFQAVSIDGYGKRNSIDCLDLILLDIEGGELNALKGAEQYLSHPAETAPVVIFEVHRSYTDWSNGLDKTPIMELLRGHGYTCYALRDYNSNAEMGDKPIELVDLDGIWLEGPPHGFNMIALKDAACLEGGNFTIVKGVSPKLLMHRDPRYHAPLE